MNIDDLLSPYRGFDPTGDVVVADTTPGSVITLSRVRQMRASRRGPELPSPEQWHMSDFVQALRGA